MAWNIDRAAARHSGAPRVDVYAEAAATGLDVFVRDVGKGFDPSDVAADRRGVSESIVRRMERLGGTASITSSADAGTEIEIRLSGESA